MNPGSEKLRKVCAHTFIQGRVQGVSFRWWIKRNADNLGLEGWVRNLEDGRVEAVFEGEKSKVKKVIEKSKDGPAFAKVTHMDVFWEKAEGKFQGFSILR